MFYYRPLEGVSGNPDRKSLDFLLVLQEEVSLNLRGLTDDSNPEWDLSESGTAGSDGALARITPLTHAHVESFLSALTSPGFGSNSECLGTPP